jgi:hypothetical protein
MKSYFEMETINYLHYLAKPFLALQNLFCTPKGLIILFPSFVAVSNLSTLNTAWIVLFIVYIIDFITGIIASFVERIKKEKEAQKVDKFTFIEKVIYFFDNISSDKIKHSLIKAVGYTIFIFCSYAIEHAFQIKPFSFSFSNLDWNLTLVALAAAISIEVWSILFENLKRIGFDIVKSGLGIFIKVRSIKEKIEENSGT